MADGKKDDAFEDFLDQFQKTGSKSGAVTPSSSVPENVDAYVSLLKTLQQDYAKPVAFKPGDFVTPRPCAFYKQIGEPHVVLEVLKEARVDWENSDPGNHNHGSRLDMRIACAVVDRGKPGKVQAVLPYWVEAWQFEHWLPKKDKEPSKS